MSNSDDKKYWLNEFGRREWINKKHPHITAHRAYYWKDRVIILDESKGRLYLESTPFSTFQTKYWTIVDKRYIRKMKIKELNEKVRKNKS